MNFHAPVSYQTRSYSDRLSEHYAAVRARLGGSPGIRPAEIPAAAPLLLPAPKELHAVADPIPDQRGAELVLPIGNEAEVIAAMRALAIFARLREGKPSTHSVRHMQMAVAAAFKVDVWVILGRSRRPGPVRVRQIAITLARRCCVSTLNGLSLRFDRNHATVLYTERKHAAFLDGASSRIGTI